MTDPEAPVSFDDARQRFAAFLRKNGYPENVLWVDQADLIWDRRQLRIHDYPASLEHARKHYADGIKAGLGINLHAFATAGATTIAAIRLPLDGARYEKWLRQKMEESRAAAEAKKASAAGKTGPAADFNQSFK